MKEINVGFEFNGVKKIRITDEEYDMFVNVENKFLTIVTDRLEAELAKEGYDGFLDIQEYWEA